MKPYERIRKKIKEKGLKFKTVAEMGGYKLPTLSTMLSGKRRLYDYDIIKLCKILDAQPCDFLTLDNGEN